MATRRTPVPTTIADWTRSDLYHNSFLIPEDSTLERALKYSRDNGLPDIGVSPAQGKFLNLLAKSIQAQRILEVGTLAGYSTIWMAQALPADGHVTTLEISEKHAEIAKHNFEQAGVANKVTVIVGPATDTIKTLQPEQPYDLVFIDADKESNLIYFAEAKKRLRKGGIIVVDNVVRNGRVADPNNLNEDIEGVRKLLKGIKDDSEVEATTIATVGEKGYDGFLYAIKK